MSAVPRTPAPRDLLRETVDLADQDRASGHLTVFWHQRVLALCEWRAAASPAWEVSCPRCGAGPGVSCIGTDGRLVADHGERAARAVRPELSEKIVAHRCHGTLRAYPPELCSVCRPSEPIGVMTLPELVGILNGITAGRGLPTVVQLAAWLTAADREFAADAERRGKPTMLTFTQERFAFSAAYVRARLAGVSPEEALR